MMNQDVDGILEDESLELDTLFENLDISEQPNTNGVNTSNESTTDNVVSNNLELTYFNPNVNSWNQANLKSNPTKRLHRRNVPTFRHTCDDSLFFKQNFLAKLDWYKRINYKKARIHPKSERMSNRRLWNVYSAPSREWMMSGDCKDSAKLPRRRERSNDFQLLIPVITNSGNQKWLDVSIREIEDIIRNLKTKTCFRIRHLIFQRNKYYYNDR